MHKLFIGGLTAATLFATPAIASAQPVNSISGPGWSTYNRSTVTKTPDGVRFGTYADGGDTGGILRYTLDSPVKLSDVTDASYQFNYNQASASPNAVPFLKLYLDNGKHVMLDPTACNSTLVDTGADESLSMTDGNADLLYDDDGCGPNAHHVTWQEMIDQHGDENVVKIVVMQGFSGGTDLSALLKSFTFNGEKFDFTGAPLNGQDGLPGADGQPGANGTNGVNGHDVSNGSNGANGAQGSAGQNGSNGTTTVIYVPVANTKLVGNTMRTLRVSTRKGNLKLIGLKANLRGKRMFVKGNTITVDLSNRSVGNYNVAITAKYRKGGTIRTVHSSRALSVTLA